MIVAFSAYLYFFLLVHVSKNLNIFFLRVTSNETFVQCLRSLSIQKMKVVICFFQENLARTCDIFVWHSHRRCSGKAPFGLPRYKLTKNWESHDIWFHLITIILMSLSRIKLAYYVLRSLALIWYMKWQNCYGKHRVVVNQRWPLAYGWICRSDVRNSLK